MLGGAHASRSFTYAPSNTLVGCYVGVSSGYPAVAQALGRRNIWWYASEVDVDYDTADMTAPPKMLYIAAPAPTEPAIANANPDDHSMIVFSPGSFEVASRTYRQSPQAHAELRERMLEQILRVLTERVFPGMRSHVKLARMLTPGTCTKSSAARPATSTAAGWTPSGSFSTRPHAPHRQPPHGLRHVGLAGIATGCQTASHVAEKLTGVRV